MSIYLPGIVKLLEKQCVLFNSRYPECVVYCSDRDDKMVVLEVENLLALYRLAFRNALLRIYRNAFRLVVSYLVPGGSYRFDYASEFDRPDSSAGKERREQKVIARTHDCDLVQREVDPFDKTQGCETASENCQPLFIGCHIVCLSMVRVSRYLTQKTPREFIRQDREFHCAKRPRICPRQRRKSEHDVPTAVPEPVSTYQRTWSGGRKTVPLTCSRA
jgi:hypothetical protein